jgi:hypothetical protein
MTWQVDGANLFLGGFVLMCLEPQAVGIIVELCPARGTKSAIAASWSWKEDGCEWRFTRR